jgi:hypothetical protein
MKKYLLVTLLIMFFSFKSWSQIDYESGYFIKEPDEKVQCLIRNVDWKNNPTEFRYRLSENDPVQVAGIQTVKEFGITGYSKYVRADVKLDKSDKAINKLSFDKEPQFQEELVFLKLLVEGTVTLLTYEDKNITRYFYQSGSSEIVPLIYKQYMTDKGVATNDDYKKQLLTNFYTHGVTMSDLQDIKYSTKDLERLFIKMNDNSGSHFTNFEDKKKDVFNLTLKPGVNFNKLSVQSEVSSFYNTDFDMEKNFRFGVEAEFIFPFFRNKFGILVEPSYQYYQAEHPASLERFSSEVNYQSIEFAGGIRYYFFLNDKSKIYINPLFVYEFDFNSTIKIIRFEEFVQENLQVKSKINMAAVAGYKYKNKYSFEIRYYTKRELLVPYTHWAASYNSFSVTLGYTIF